MPRTLKILTTTLLLATAAAGAFAQTAETATTGWTLEDCLAYAETNSINVLQAQNTYSSAEEDFKASKAAFAPSISASSSQTYSFNNIINNYNGRYSASYGINMSMSLFQGGKLVYSKKQNDLIRQSREAGVLSAKKEISISVLQAYLQVLYARESMLTAQSTFELSQAEYDRYKALYEAGSANKSDLSQIATQWSQNKYNLQVSENNLRTYITDLKQLLEIGIAEDFSIRYPVISDEEVLQPLPEMMEIYETAMSVMPQIKEAELNIQSSETALRVAKAGWIPSISLSAGLSSSYLTQEGGSPTLGQQFTDNFGANVGLSISIPIYDKRSTRTSVNKAKLTIENNRLSYESAEKEIADYVESLYIDAVNAQANYSAAKEQAEFAEDSYNLVREQFREGLKNAVDLLTEENNLFKARQTLVESRYQAVISIQLLNLLQDKEVSLGSYSD